MRCAATKAISEGKLDPWSQWRQGTSSRNRNSRVIPQLARTSWRSIGWSSCRWTPTAACFLRSCRDGTFAYFPSPRRPSCFLGSLRTSSNASAMGYSFNSRQGKDLYLRLPCPFHDSSIFPNLVLFICFQILRAKCKYVCFLCCALFFGETAACRNSCKRTWAAWLSLGLSCDRSSRCVLTWGN